MENPIERTEILKMTINLLHAGHDCPFSKDQETTVLRRRDNGKWFGIWLRVPRRIFGEGQGSEFALNLKCEPVLARMLRTTYAGIVPAYHMNKVHWLTVRLNGSVPREEVEKLLCFACELAGRKSSQKR